MIALIVQLQKYLDSDEPCEGFFCGIVPEFSDIHTYGGGTDYAKKAIEIAFERHWEGAEWTEIVKTRGHGQDNLP